MTTQPQQLATDSVLSFPADFTWGVATAAYQIEGAAGEDGRTPSIWDTFCREPGRVHEGHNGDVACDHYHRYRDDVALMAGLSIEAYRFSLSWPRTKPHPDGTVNTRGLDFYDRLVDELLGNGITPMATLYHWDLPQYLEDAGGWTSRETADRFVELAQVCHARLGDRVHTWTTLNEPWCSGFLGYASGDHAPGHRDPAAAFAAVHHLLLGHGMAALELKQGGAEQVSLTLNLTPVRPADPGHTGDVEAARLIDGLHNRLFLEPVLRGAYPEDMLENAARFGGLGWLRDGDERTIAAPIDLLGVNYYRPTIVAARPGLPEDPQFPGSGGIRFLDGDRPTTDMGWMIDASGLTELLLRLHRDYPGIPLIVTENGAAFPDTVVDGEVPDHDRVDFLREHLRAAHVAIEAGVDLRGYLVWSLLDNFEWAYGYDKRFGLVHVDYRTQRRLPKRSAHWYADVIRANAVRI